MGAESKHTPGPWILENCDGDLLVIGPDDGSICEVHFETQDVGDPKFETAEAAGAANGKLIAAAPDLLEALQALLDAAPFSGGPDWCNCESTEDGGDATDCVHIKARAAIAKATGETSR